MAPSRKKQPQKDPGAVDRERLHVALQGLDREALLDLLERALEAVPEKRIPEILRGVLAPADVRPGPKLLLDVGRFDQRSRASEYYEDFNVNSRNYMNLSKGTRTWMAECQRLFERCVREAEAHKPADLRAAISLLLELLRRLDAGEDDIVFFADEGGAWQVGRLGSHPPRLVSLPLGHRDARGACPRGSADRGGLRPPRR